MKTKALVLSLLTIVMFLAAPLASAYSISGNDTQTLAWFNKDKEKNDTVKAKEEKHHKKVHHKHHKKMHHEVKPQAKMSVERK